VPKVNASNIPIDVGVCESKNTYMNTLANLNEEHESWSCCFWNESEFFEVVLIDFLKWSSFINIHFNIECTLIC
jgi:hypothetical protein